MKENQLVFVDKEFVMTLTNALKTVAMLLLDNANLPLSILHTAIHAKLMMIALASLLTTILLLTAELLIATRKDTADLEKQLVMLTAQRPLKPVSTAFLFPNAILLNVLLLAKVLNVFTLKLNVMMVINALVTTVMLKLENVYILKLLLKIALFV